MMIILIKYPPMSPATTVAIYASNRAIGLPTARTEKSPFPVATTAHDCFICARHLNHVWYVKRALQFFIPKSQSLNKCNAFVIQPFWKVRQSFSSEAQEDFNGPIQCLIALLLHQFPPYNHTLPFLR
jgi:hypothetical protein